MPRLFAGPARRWVLLTLSGSALGALLLPTAGIAGTRPERVARAVQYLAGDGRRWIAYGRHDAPSITFVDTSRRIAQTVSMPPGCAGNDARIVDLAAGRAILQCARFDASVVTVHGGLVRALPINDAAGDPIVYHALGRRWALGRTGCCSVLVDVATGRVVTRTGPSANFALDGVSPTRLRLCVRGQNGATTAFRYPFALHRAGSRRLVLRDCRDGRSRTLTRHGFEGAQLSAGLVSWSDGSSGAVRAFAIGSGRRRAWTLPEPAAEVVHTRTAVYATTIGSEDYPVSDTGDVYRMSVAGL